MKEMGDGRWEMTIVGGRKNKYEWIGGKRKGSSRRVEE